MAESADRQARRESLERELQNVRSIIRALRSGWNHPGASRSRVPVGTSRGKGGPTAGGARRTGRRPGLGGSRAKKNPLERAFKGEAHVGAERGLRVHNVLAAREFRAEQNFLRCSRSVTLRWKSLSAAREAKRQRATPKADLPTTSMHFSA